MTSMNGVRLPLLTVALAALLTTSACSAGTTDEAGSATTSSTTSSTTPSTTPSSAPATPSTPCSFPAKPVERLAARWQTVVLAPDAPRAEADAVTYRDAIGRFRASFALACPELEETFNLVFVDAQFLVGQAGSTGSEISLDDVAGNGNRLLEALGLQDEVQYVAPDCTAARQDEPECLLRPE